MRRALVALCLVALGAAADGQALGTLRVTIVVTDAEQNATPVARHVLLVSANPPDAPPRAVTTGRDGTITIRLRPGNYIVESEKPVGFQGRTYEWAQRVSIAAGTETVLQLTGANATIDTPTAGVATDASFILPRWQSSVFALWTPTMHATGFLIDAEGLIATNQRVVGTATEVEVQVSPQVKVMARVLAADPERDVAILWMDPAVSAGLEPVPVECAQASAPAVAVKQELFTIGTPLRGDKSFLSAPAGRLERRAIIADWRLPSGSSGGPVFNAAGELVGLTSISPDDDVRTWATRVVRLEDACAVIAAARAKKPDAAAPSAARLPVEPARLFATAALEAAAKGRAGSLTPPQLSSSQFDVAFITPVLTFAGQRAPGGGTGADALRAIRDFANWSEYVAEFPPVLLVRVTPRQVEGIWSKVGRAAAMTQGVALPAMKRASGSFARLRLFCGQAEVTPIHPFLLEHRVEADLKVRLYEGLYVFAHDALGPHCATATLTLYAEEAPGQGDTRPIDPAVLTRVWQDFAAYRAAAAPIR